MQASTNGNQKLHLVLRCDFLQACAICCRLDIPKAPLLLGNLLGQAASEQAADGAALQKLCEPIEDTEARRELISCILKFVQVMHTLT